MHRKITTARLGNKLHDQILKQSKGGESVDDTLKRLLGILSPQNGDSKKKISSFTSVRMSPEVRAYISSNALKGEMVEQTIQRLLGSGKWKKS